MLNKAIIFFLSFFICNVSLISYVQADELNSSSEAYRKYNLSVCAIFKNEAKYLKEWIEYHRSLGVDHFYLYNIGSRDSFQSILRPYFKEGLVTLINWPEALSYQDENDTYKWALSTQIPAYENAVNFLARGETKWLVFLNINEYLMSPEVNIKDLLKKYDDFPGISFSSEFFDAVVHDDHPNKILLTQSLALTNPPAEIVEKSVARMIFKPDLCIGFNWPPYQCRFKNSQSSIEVNPQELQINHYMNRFIEEQKPTVQYGIQLEDNYVIEDRPIFENIDIILKKIRYEIE